ncbi:MAG: thiol-disulfide oxidoreductase [Gemmatimonadetes bacterium]|nr:thiol-disulfide oxidoreductase [Gemmatimonadota bacterium]
MTSPTVPVVSFTIAGRDRDVPSAGLGRAYTVVFDGQCKVCTRLSNVLRRWDRGEMEVVSSQTPGVMARFPWIPPKAYTQSLQVIGPGGVTYQGAAAIERILDVLPRGKWISWVFSIPFVRVLADRFYRWFARNRYRLGCGEHCASRQVQTSWPD